MSERRGVSRNTISALVSNLEAQGLVQRRIDVDDRRRFIVELTEAGRELARKQANVHYQTMSSFFDALSPDEQETLIELLEKLATDPRLNPRPDMRLVERAAQTPGALGRAMSYLWRYPRLAILATVALLIATGAQLVVPQLVQNIIDTITQNATKKALLDVPSPLQQMLAEQLSLDIGACGSAWRMRRCWPG